MTPIRLSMLALMLAAAPSLAAAPEEANAPAVKKVESRELIESLSGKSVDGANPEHEAILSKCSAMKFETSVEVGSGADAHITKVKMCSRDGETKEQWIASLTDAAAKIGANQELAADSRAQLIAAINAEIARLKS